LTFALTPTLTLTLTLTLTPVLTLTFILTLNLNPYPYPYPHSYPYPYPSLTTSINTVLSHMGILSEINVFVLVSLAGHRFLGCIFI
jgi:hypothetical protein